MPPPTPKEDWLVKFENELLLNLRPDIGQKFAHTIAVNLWTRCKAMDPREAARQWAETAKGSK